MRQSRYSTLRWALALAAVATALCGPSAAQAGTGGASSFVPAPTAASTSAGADFAFSTWRSGGASWYGPGLYGNSTACGQTLRPSTLGVAHKTLPCGTVVKFRHRGHVLVTQVIDRGPYIAGRSWDLTEAASEALDFESVGVGRVQYAVATSFARK
jgi:rare lipoprotein A (peptidoglycan hydrolase)